MKLMYIFAASASCALIGVLAAIASPANGQNQPYSGYTSGGYGYSGNGPQYSTPTEQAQTRALNQQAVDGTTQSPAALNGEAQGYSGGRQSPSYGNSQSNGYGANPNDQYGAQGYPQQPDYNNPPTDNGGPPQDPPPSAQQRNYNQRMDEYGQQQNVYRQQRQRYDSDRAQYHADLRAYDQAIYDWAYPAPIYYAYGDDHGLERLYLIADPSQQLDRISVEGPGGRWVGRVRNVETAADGRPSRVEVALNRRVSVWVEPGDLRYDPVNHVLFTDLTRDQLWQEPGVTFESGPM